MENFRIALLGNPNTGKTTLFNSLCKTRQRTGNYPGVTVERREGKLIHHSLKALVIDLPGVYSLNAGSPDETITSEYISGKLSNEPHPNLLLVIIDASNLKRNLYLLHQALESSLPMMVVLTMSDVAEKKGIHIDTNALAKSVGVPVVKVTEGNKQHVDDLINTMEQFRASDPKQKKTSRGRPDKSIKKKSLKKKSEGLPSSPAERYAWADSIMKLAVTYDVKQKKDFTLPDKILTHRIFGLAVFVFIMGFMFQSVYSWAKPVIDTLDAGFGALGNLSATYLTSYPVLSSLISDGIIAGAGSVIVFLPQIIILFIFVAVLEDSGYLARAAFMVDKLLGWTGLNGRSFIPLLSSFACAIPGIMSARVLPDERTRIATILISPLMSCSARLRVNILFISAIIEPRYGALVAGLTFFGMHILGLMIALPTAWFLNRDILKQRPVPFILELPPYRMPSLRNVIYRVYDAVKRFTLLAGTTIVALSVIIWALTYFPRSEKTARPILIKYDQKIHRIEKSVMPADKKKEMLTALHSEQENALKAAWLEDSYLGRTGKFIEPAFSPIGFDWKISVGILAAFPAREVIISTLGIIYNLGNDVDEESVPLRKKLQNEKNSAGKTVYTPLTVISLLVFFALCAQCMSTLVTIRRELNSIRWPVFLFFYMTGLAYLFSFIVYQGGKLLGG
jgi:ferrous iron transport protein B